MLEQLALRVHHVSGYGPIFGVVSVFVVTVQSLAQFSAHDPEAEADALICAVHSSRLVTAGPAMSLTLLKPTIIVINDKFLKSFFCMICLLLLLNTVKLLLSFDGSESG